MRAPLRWDVFCRVVDNFGDIGVCWRLAADLAERGEQVRLWVDDASALRWMAPDGAPNVAVKFWPSDDAATAATGDPGNADVVVEAFGCALPPAVVDRMARRPAAPVWINLEYLSAEAVVERNHRLPSPVATGPGAGLTKWFFYPGFTPRTGGLVRERDLAARQRAFDAPAWRAAHAAIARPGERVVSLFCYEAAPLAALVERLAQQPTLLLATAGIAARRTADLLGPDLRRDALRAVTLPPLTQRDYDHLLWASDLNFVRGEDSFVRAQWAGVPFVWQVYPQQDGAHFGKLEAFLDRFAAGGAADADAIRRLWRAWNGGTAASSAAPSLPALPPLPAWRERCLGWRESLRGQADLASGLLGFAAESR